MFIIFGTPRSGTTLLAQCLDTHPDIVIPRETDFIVPLVFIFTRIKDPDLGREMISKLITNSIAFQGSIGEYLSTDQVNQIVYNSKYHPTDILVTIYEEIARSAGAKTSGDKSPNDLDSIKILVDSQSVTSRMKIVHIVRDIRDLMISLNRTGWLPNADLHFPRLWSNNNLYLHTKFKDHPAQYILVRYEDLVRDPHEVLVPVCERLGVEFQLKMLNTNEHHPRYRQDRGNLYQPISTHNVGIYKNQLNKETLSLYETQAREALITFGYLNENNKPWLRKFL
jgi:hypothetical protein